MILQLIETCMSSIGTLMVGYAAIQIHHRIMHEHTIDHRVLTEMKREQRVALGGVTLIILALLLDIYIILLS